MREFLTPSLHELQDLSAYLVSNDAEGGHGKRVSGSASNCSGDSDTDQPKKKLGRKPANTEPANKRIAQNRQAQRLYRERKEQHVKDLERQVEELKAASTGNAGASVLGLEMENGALKAQNAALLKQVADLQTENAMLRQMTFSYDFGSGVGVGATQAGSSPSSSLVSQTNSAFLQNVSPFSSPSFGLGFPNLAAVSPNSLMKSPASVSVPSPASTDLVSLLGSHVSQKPYSSALDFSVMFPPTNGAPDFGKVPIDVRLDSFMFDDQDWLTMSGLTSSASVNKPTTAPAVLNPSATRGIKALSENGEEDVLAQLADVSGLADALKSVPSLKDKAYLVDDVCFVFQEFISKATKAIMEGRTAPDCPLEMYKKKLAIIESCQGDAVDSQRVLDIFAVTKEKFCGFLDKAACAGTCS
ncbi:hypothetical protein HDU77_009319 [Chytriomyces hyalinus]|nr:hypothetical protein HDU77_009319 [Chytriomyces hyalinus]